MKITIHDPAPGRHIAECEPRDSVEMFRATHSQLVLMGGSQTWTQALPSGSNFTFAAPGVRIWQHNGDDNGRTICWCGFIHAPGTLGTPSVTPPEVPFFKGAAV